MVGESEQFDRRAGAGRDRRISIFAEIAEQRQRKFEDLARRAVANAKRFDRISRQT